MTELIPEPIPEPRPVADIVGARRPGRAQPPDGYLSYEEVLVAWPTVWILLPVAAANGVRVEQEYHYVPGSPDAAVPVFHAGDVQRVAEEITAGTAVVRPEWLRTTAEGRAAIAAADRAGTARMIRTICGVSVFVLVLLALLVLPPLLLT